MHADDMEYMRLAAAERRAWEALEGRLPGNPEFDGHAWDEWRRAIKAVAAELARRGAPGDGAPSGGRPRA